jgi:hypothetical protein
MNKLSQKEQIEKLNFLAQLANERKAGNLADKLATFIIFNGFVDFHVIQAARLMEQIVLKSQLAQGKQPTFRPRGDDYFYNEQISTRRILKEIKKLLPVSDERNLGKNAIVNGRIDYFLKVANKFLDYLNAIIHRLGSPNTLLSDLDHCCDEALSYYEKVLTTQKEMFEILEPYGFSQKEINHFYDHWHEIYYLK